RRRRHSARRHAGSSGRPERRRPPTRPGAAEPRLGGLTGHSEEIQGVKDMTERVVLAYSGGLDTSVAIGWIAEETGAEVIACAVDVGQGGEDLETIATRAKACGAVDVS